jgi:DNA-directed RNA polymerase subunit RPC12/RpoP
MTRTGTRIGTVGILVLAMAAGALLLTGCGKKRSEGPKLPEAISFKCEKCGHIFGIATDTPQAERKFPPVVCPKCGERAAVQAYFYEPKAGGPPELYRLFKYSDKQIKEYEDTIKRLIAEHEQDPRNPTPDQKPPDSDVPVGGEIETYEKYVDTDWLQTWGEKAQGRATKQNDDELRAKYKSLTPVFDPSWPIVEAKDIKQWK